MARRSYTLTLRRDGHVVSTRTTTDGDPELNVGRSHSCDVAVPPDEMSVSGTHASLYWDRGHLYIADANSRNGVFRQGVKISKPCKVRPGDVYAIGNCSLTFAENKMSAGKHVDNPHKLEWLNGDKAGKTIDIRPKTGETAFTIGMDPGSTLVIPDMLVSRHHVELTTRDNGECWIRDLGSRNGTYINGEVLRGRERLLKNNDRIGIAYFDFRFLDKDHRHPRFHMWMKLFAVAVTLGLASLAWLFHDLFGKSVEDCLDICKKMAAEERFDDARQALDEAKLARGSDKKELVIGELETSLGRWEETAKKWHAVKADLVAGDLDRAREVLDPLVARPPTDWQWNPADALEKRRTAEFAVELLKWDYSCDDVLGSTSSGRPEDQADAIARQETPLREFVDRESSRIAAEPCFSNISAKLSVQLARLGKIRRSFAAVDDAIAQIDEKRPDFKALASKFKQIEHDKSEYEAVRSYANKYKLPCEELAEAQELVIQEGQDLIALRFGMIATNQISFRLPKKELCARHPQLSIHRTKIEQQHERILSLARSVASIVEGLASRGVENGNCDTALQRTLSQEAWKRALSFDCLDGPPPKAKRKDPCGFYDEFLGIEYAYQALRALPGAYNGLALRMVGFTPNVVDAKRTLEQVEYFVNFIDEGPDLLRKGALGEFREYARSLLEDREVIVGYLSSFQGEPRAKLMASYYAYYLKDGGTLAQRKQLSADFKMIQKSVTDLYEKYRVLSDPVEQIGLRAKIMSIGFPGDPVVHSMWVQKHTMGASGSD